MALCQNSLSSHIFNLLPKLSEFAEKSIICHQHSAVVLENGTPVTWGYNNIKGNSTLHAECNAIKQFLRVKGLQYFKKRRDNKPQCILWV